MEFGRVPEELLDTIDFTLPADPIENKTVLEGKSVSKPQVYIGCAKWGRPEWVGKIYPLRTKEKDFLQHYVHHYNSIELNATHYRIWGEAGTRKWADKAKERDFRFCPKMYKGITHDGKLNGKDFLINEFFRGIIGFGNQLGPVFIQVSDSFSPKRKAELFTFLNSLPKEFQFFLEVRHSDWFLKQNDREDLLSFLHDNNIGIIITDTAGRRDCAHMFLTIPKAFIRFVGNSLHPTDYPRIDAWVERMKYWLDHGLQELYFFMHMHDEAKSPELTVYLVDKMNELCGLNLLKPLFIENTNGNSGRQKELFD